MNDRATMDDFANLLLTDPLTSASILRRANSAMYSKNKSINTLTMAITILGINTITELLYQSLVEQITNSVNLTKTELVSFWRKSLTKAFVAKEFGRELGITDIEQLFISGLLSQIGCLPIICFSPENYYMSHKSKVLFPWAKQNSLTGFSINELSYELLSTWEIPPRITIPIKHAHDEKVQLNKHANILHAAWLATLPHLFPNKIEHAEVFNIEIFDKLKLNQKALKSIVDTAINNAEASLPTFI